MFPFVVLKLWVRLVVPAHMSEIALGSKGMCQLQAAVLCGLH